MDRTKGYVDQQYLETLADLLKKNKQRSYDWMRVGLGQSVLDVGCGSGNDTVALAYLLGPAGRVVGVDTDPEMIVAADRPAAAPPILPDPITAISSLAP